MLLKLLLLLVLVPLVELALLLQLAEWMGGWLTFLLVIVTGLVGSLLAHSQGWRTAANIRQELAAGRPPARALVDAVLIFVAGALLLTPGLLTDAVGLGLLIPPLRTASRNGLIDWFRKRFHFQTTAHPGDATTGDAPQVIDSFVVRTDDESVQNDSPDVLRDKQPGRGGPGDLNHRG